MQDGTDIWLPKTCGFLGSGQMADALLSGLLDKRAFLKDNILVSDISLNRLDYMSQKFGVKTTLDNKGLTDEL
jgi:pyrroline-5-carboxylate reductase